MYLCVVNERDKVNGNKMYVHNNDIPFKYWNGECIKT